MTLLTCTRVSKRYRATAALTDVNFVLREGTVSGLIGPNGSGKTTLMKIIAGLCRPSSGTVALGPPELPRSEHGAPSVGAYFGVANLHPGRTVLETLRLAAFLSGSTGQRVQDRLEWSGLATAPRRLVRGLSLGMRVRLGIAVATMHSPSILLLDEPMNGLDLDGIAWIKSFVDEVRDDGGTVLLSSHLLRELEPLVDRSLILSKGRLVADTAIAAERVSPCRVRVRVDDDERFERCLAAQKLVYFYTHGAWIVESTLDSVGRSAFEAGIAIFELSSLPAESLEDLVARSTRGEFRPRTAGAPS